MTEPPDGIPNGNSCG